MHQHAHEITLGLSFALGALHALEPGHGKTAMLVYLASGNRSIWHPVAMGISTAVSHSVSLLAIAFAVHLAHHVFAAEHHHEGLISLWLQWISGGMIVVIGLWMLCQSLRTGPQQSCCSHHSQPQGQHDAESHKGTANCQAPQPIQLHSLSVSPSAARSAAETGTTPAASRQSELENHPPNGTGQGRQGYMTTIMLGIAIGMLPCPSALAAYFTGLASGTPAQAYLVIILFGLGIACSLSMVGIGLRFFGSRLSGRFSASKLNWGLVRGTLILLIGLVYTSRLYLA